MPPNSHPEAVILGSHELDILEELAEHGNATVYRLSDKLGMPATNLYYWISILENKELIKKHRLRKRMGFSYGINKKKVRWRKGVFKLTGYLLTISHEGSEYQYPSIDSEVAVEKLGKKI